MYAKTSISSRAWQFALALMFLVGILLPTNGAVQADTTVTNPSLPSSFSRPTWWHNTTDNCDSTWYNSHKTGGGNATLQTSWRGLQSCGPKPGTSGGYATPDFPASAYDKNMFQCTELVARYLEVGYGLHSVQGNGDELAAAYKTAYPDDFDQYSNDGTAVYPQEGDVLSMAVSGTSTGHTAVVTGLSVSDTPGTATITLMDQNGSANGTFTLSVVDYVIQPTATYSNYVWIHPHQFIANSPTASVYTTITSVATDGSNAWIAGHDRTGGANFQPTTWYWNGSSWTKYNPPSQGLYNMQYINDIAIGQSNEAWAVGYYYNNSRDLNQAFRWNPSTLSWSRVTTDNAGISTSLNHLNSVGMDGSANIWAVGYYNNSGNKPLLLKWNGTKFADQGLALPSGTTSGTLTSVSFSSSNGWAVGTFNGGSTGYVFYYDGSSWSPYALPSGMNINQSVVTISADEAWGVGYYNSTFRFLHYTTANGWVADTSFTLASGVIYSISGDSSSNVWAVGTRVVGSQPAPFFLHYDGNGWYQVSAPTYSEYTDLKDVSVVSGKVWAAGNRYVSSTPRYPVVLVK